MNKSLLLITRIETHQLQDDSIINITELIKRLISSFSENYEYKNQNIVMNINKNVLLKAEMLIEKRDLNNRFVNIKRVARKETHIVIKFIISSLFLFMRYLYILSVNSAMANSSPISEDSIVDSIIAIGDKIDSLS